MNRWMKLAALVAMVVLLPLTASPSVSRPVRDPPEVTLYSFTSGLQALYVSIGGYVLPSARGFTITGMTVRVTTASGGGAGNTIWTVTDGTNTCTVTMPCATSQSTGSYRFAAANGSGTGCVYAPGASLSASVSTAGCTTTQPTIGTFAVLGSWVP